MSSNAASPEGTRATSPLDPSSTSNSNSIVPPSALLSPTTAEDRHRPMDRSERASRRKTSQNLRDLRASLIEGGPSSIPSSPTSVHSSSSAIFERDIEPLFSPLTPPSHPHAHAPLSGVQSPGSLQSPTSPSSGASHRIPRSRTTEQIEHAVPSVLDSAAAILATLDIDPSTSTNTNTTAHATGSSWTSAEPVNVSTLDQIAVVAPATTAFDTLLASPGGRTSGFASPLSLRSRSPSPLGRHRNAALGGTDLLLNIPTSAHIVSSTVSSPTRSPNSRQATLGSPGSRQATLASSPTFRSTGLSSSPPVGGFVAPPMGSSVSRDSTLSALSADTPLLSPTSEDPNALQTSAAPNSLHPTSNPTSPTRSTHPSPHTVTKRLSFMSYADLLSSTPASTMPLASLTVDAKVGEPPAHIPSVTGIGSSLRDGSMWGGTSRGGSRTPSVHGFGLSHPGGMVSSPGKREVGLASPGKREAGLASPAKRDSVVLAMLEDAQGGEWEREGMGLGLEERLERVVG